MKIAITAETSEGLDAPVAGHFGHAPYFAFVDLVEGHPTSVQAVENPFATGHQPGQIPAYIHEQGADAIISGGMGGRAVQFFNDYGVAVATGASGTVGQSVEAFLAGQLGGDATCTGHDDHH